MNHNGSFVVVLKQGEEESVVIAMCQSENTQVMKPRTHEGVAVILELEEADSVVGSIENLAASRDDSYSNNAATVGFVRVLVHRPRYSTQCLEGYGPLAE
jgi:hypothetical protein